MNNRAGYRFAHHSQQGGIFFRLLFLFFLGGVAFRRLPRASSAAAVRRQLLGRERIAAGFRRHRDSGRRQLQGDRATRAAELFKAGWAPRVIASGRYLRPYASIAELEEHDLAERGVPAAAIVRFAHHAENTREEAIAISQLISSRGWKRIMLVTSNYHTRRSQYICRASIPCGNGAARGGRARLANTIPNNWWQNRARRENIFPRVGRNDRGDVGDAAQRVRTTVQTVSQFPRDEPSQICH